VDWQRNLRWISAVEGARFELYGIRHSQISENSERLRKFGDFCMPDAPVPMAWLSSPH
jgi:hypothetical protein